MIEVELGLACASNTPLPIQSEEDNIVGVSPWRGVKEIQMICGAKSRPLGGNLARFQAFFVHNFGL